ncbi:MAG: 3-keto-disaccharide hydrolase [Planctomycetota bacterium]
MIFICNCGTGRDDVGVDKVNWQYIFDGKTLTGWVQRGGKTRYQVEDGAIVGTAVANTPNSFLCTEKHYSDFILELEFKIDAGLNSGVQIRSNSFPEYKNGRVHGYQVEIDPSVKPYTRQPRNLLADGSFAPVGEPRRWTGGIYDEGRRGWLYNLTKNEKARRAFKQGQWNHFRIEAIGDSIKSWLNTVPAADMKDSQTSSGFIGLQVHRVKSCEPLSVRWRNIRIKDLGRD